MDKCISTLREECSYYHEGNCFVLDLDLGICMILLPGHSVQCILYVCTYMIGLPCCIYTCMQPCSISAA